MSYGQFGLSRNQMLGIGGGVGALGLAGGGAYALHRRRKARLAAEAEAAMLDEADEAEYAMALARSARFGLSRNQMLGIGGGVGAVALGGGGAYMLNRRRKARLAAEAEAALLADEADEAEYAMALAQSARFGLSRNQMLGIGGGVGALGLAGGGAYALNRRRKAQLAAEAEAALLAEEDDDAMYAMARPSAANFMGRRLGSRVVDALEGGIQNTVGRRMMMGSGTARKAARRLAVGGGIAAGVGAVGAGGYGVYRATRPPVVEEEMDDEYIDE